MSESKQDEFFIGWQAESPVGIRKLVRKVAISMLLIGILLSAALAYFQSTVTGGRLLFGKVKDFQGVIVADPLPMLILNEPEEFTGQRIFLLTGQMKNGFDVSLANNCNLAVVKMKGQLLFDDYNAMIEMVDDSLEIVSDPKTNPLPPAVQLGDMTIKGEIVDSKCYLGMMNPGVLNSHRACAIKCIEGGIPPLFLLRDGAGNTNKLIMTDPNGKAINQQVIDFVAEPIEITGKVTRRGPLLFIAVDPSSFKRLS